MKTLQFLEERSRENDFPLQICLAGILTAIGGPLVIVPAAGFVAVDALVSLLAAAPRALSEAADVPSQLLNQIQRIAAIRSEETRNRLEREAQDMQTERAEEQRASRSEIAVLDARSEVIRFYEANRRFLADTLPFPLFRSQIQIRFPRTIGGEAAWQAAQAMITEMLPLVASGKERWRSDEVERKKQNDDAAATAKLERDVENSRHAVGRLTEWYEREKAKVEELLKDETLRDVALMALYDRFDYLLKEALQEAKP